MIVLALFTACKTPPPVADPLAIAPGDFSLDVTVVTNESHTLAHMRSSRYVVFPDGSLHHGDGQRDQRSGTHRRVRDERRGRTRR